MSTTVRIATATNPARAVWLQPRPLARTPSSFLLLPLLPDRPAPRPMPPEVWAQILEHTYAFYGPRSTYTRARVASLRVGLLLISRDIHAVALPLFYAHIHVYSIQTLEKLVAHLHVADQRWDSIRRIPYSAPGRWIQTLDIAALPVTCPDDSFLVEALLNQISSLIPFLGTLVLSPHVLLSRRALSSLADRDGASNLRALKGVQLRTSWQFGEDAFVELLRACVRLEELEIFGTGVDTAELLLAQDSSFAEPTHFRPLHLPHLRRLAVLSMPTSPTLRALVHSPLPSLRHLTLTPYDELSVPASLIPRFITTHGPQLTSLYLHTVKQWPTALFPSPISLLDTCPSLQHLSLELPLPQLRLSAAPQHPLEILSVARPVPDFMEVLEGLLPKLPYLRFVRTRDVKWLRGGMSARAQQAGVQGVMQLWRRKLGRRGIQLLDAEWKTGAE